MAQRQEESGFVTAAKVVYIGTLIARVGVNIYQDWNKGKPAAKSSAVAQSAKAEEKKRAGKAEESKGEGAAQY